MKTTLKKPDYVIFDMDGTTVRHVNPAFLSMLEAIDNVLYKISCLMSRDKKIEDYSEDPARPRGLLVHRALHILRWKKVDKIVQPCPGIFLLLNLFKRQNIPMGIASNSLGEGYGHDILKTFKLNNYFDVEIFREDIQKSKPHPDSILRAMRGFKTMPVAGQTVWYIGDRHKDVVAAMEASKLSECRVIPFSYGINAAMGILKYKLGKDNIIVSYPDFFIRINHLFDDGK